jgi:hypothetical protein
MRQTEQGADLLGALRVVAGPGDESLWSAVHVQT